MFNNLSFSHFTCMNCTELFCFLPSFPFLHLRLALPSPCAYGSGPVTYSITTIIYNSGYSITSNSWLCVTDHYNSMNDEIGQKPIASAWSHKWLITTALNHFHSCFFSFYRSFLTSFLRFPQSESFTRIVMWTYTSYLIFRCCNVRTYFTNHKVNSNIN